MNNEEKNQMVQNMLQSVNEKKETQFNTEYKKLEKQIQERYNLKDETSQTIMQNHISYTILIQMSKIYNENPEYTNLMQKYIENTIEKIWEDALRIRPLEHMEFSPTLKFEKLEENTYKLNERIDIKSWDFIKHSFKWNEDYNCWTTLECNAKYYEKEMHLKSRINTEIQDTNYEFHEFEVLMGYDQDYKKSALMLIAYDTTIDREKYDFNPKYDKVYVYNYLDYDYETFKKINTLPFTAPDDKTPVEIDFNKLLLFPEENYDYVEYETRENYKIYVMVMRIKNKKVNFKDFPKMKLDYKLDPYWYGN